MMNCRRMAILMAVIAVCALSAPPHIGGRNGNRSNGRQRNGSRQSGRDQGRAPGGINFRFTSEAGQSTSTKNWANLFSLSVQTTTRHAAEPFSPPHPMPTATDSNTDSNSTRPTATATSPTTRTTTTTTATATRTNTATIRTKTTTTRINITTIRTKTTTTNTTPKTRTNTTTPTSTRTTTTPRTTTVRTTRKSTVRRRSRPTPAPVVESTSTGEVIGYVIVVILVVGGIAGLIFAYLCCCRRKNKPVVVNTTGTTPIGVAPTVAVPVGRGPLNVNVPKKAVHRSPNRKRSKYEDMPDLTGPDHLDVNKIRFRGPMKIPHVIIPISADEDDSNVPDLLPHEHFEIDESLNEAIEIGSEVEMVVDEQGNVIRPPRPPHPSPSPRRQAPADGNPNQLQVIRE